MESLKQNLVDYLEYTKDTKTNDRDDREKELFLSVVFFLGRVLKDKLDFEQNILRLLFHFFERELKVTESKLGDFDLDESVLFYACKYESEYGIIRELLRKLSKRRLLSRMLEDN